MSEGTCKYCSHRFSDDVLEWIAHLRSHPEVMDDPQKRVDLDRWERNHRRFLADMTEWRRRGLA